MKNGEDKSKTKKAVPHICLNRQFQSHEPSYQAGWGCANESTNSLRRQIYLKICFMWGYMGGCPSLGHYEAGCHIEPTHLSFHQLLMLLMNFGADQKQVNEGLNKEEGVTLPYRCRSPCGHSAGGLASSSFPLLEALELKIKWHDETCSSPTEATPEWLIQYNNCCFCREYQL